MMADWEGNGEQAKAAVDGCGGWQKKTDEEEEEASQDRLRPFN
jgi:hypothetical protein